MNFLLQVIWFFVKNHHRIKFHVDKSCGIRDITFYSHHTTVYDHLIKESCDFVDGGPLS